jgi:diamine N-acetyltransferase
VIEVPFLLRDATGRWHELDPGTPRMSAMTGARRGKVVRGPGWRRVDTLAAMVVTLREITDGTRDAVLALAVAPGQERFVGSVRDALELAVEYPHAKPWYRAVYVGDEPVGFIMISWNVQPQPPSIIGPWFLWKIIIDERYQGHGYGAEAVRQVAQLIRAEGATELLTSYVPQDGGPAGFYQRLGFVPTGEFDDNREPIVRLALS